MISDYPNTPRRVAYRHGFLGNYEMIKLRVSTWKGNLTEFAPHKTNLYQDSCEQDISYEKFNDWWRLTNHDGKITHSQHTHAIRVGFGIAESCAKIKKNPKLWNTTLEGGNSLRVDDDQRGKGFSSTADDWSLNQVIKVRLTHQHLSWFLHF